MANDTILLICLFITASVDLKTIKTPQGEQHYQTYFKATLSVRYFSSAHLTAMCMILNQLKLSRVVKSLDLMCRSCVFCSSTELTETWTDKDTLSICHFTCNQSKQTPCIFSSCAYTVHAVASSRIQSPHLHRQGGCRSLIIMPQLIQAWQACSPSTERLNKVETIRACCMSETQLPVDEVFRSFTKIK